MTDFEIVRVERRMTPQEATELVGSYVPDLDANVTSGTVFVDVKTDEPVLAYLPVPDKADLRRAVMNIPYGHTSRSNGIQNKSRTFGYAPRKPVHGRDGCRQTHLADLCPPEHSTLEEWANRLADMLEEIDPAIAKRDRETMDAVLSDWKMGESSLWTSGVVNRSSQLPYHRDGFNFPTWSAMPVLRRAMAGGYLSVPEYDIVTQCRDGYAVFFPGHQLVHGVTPMTPTRPDGYRYSVVYYALKGMKDCFTHAVETAHAKTARTQREREMAQRARDGVADPESPWVKAFHRGVGKHGITVEPSYEDDPDVDPHTEYAAEQAERES